MKGTAYLWWGINEERCTDWTTFVESFMNKFHGDIVQERIRSNIYTGKYREGGLTREVYAMRKFQDIKYLDPPMPEMDAVKYVAKHFPWEIYNYVALNNIVDQNVFLEYLRRVDDIKGCGSSMNNNFRWDGLGRAGPRTVPENTRDDRNRTEPRFQNNNNQIGRSWNYFQHEQRRNNWNHEQHQRTSYQPGNDNYRSRQDNRNANYQNRNFNQNKQQQERPTRNNYDRNRENQKPQDRTFRGRSNSEGNERTTVQNHHLETQSRSQENIPINREDQRSRNAGEQVEQNDQTTISQNFY